MSNIQLMKGDCLELMRGLPDGSADAVICDLPYGITACSWDSVIPFAPLWAEYKRVVKKGGAIVLFGSQPFTSALVMSNPDWFKHDTVWEKDKATGHFAVGVRPMRKHEDILVFADGRVTYNPQMTKKPAWKIRPVPVRSSPSVYEIHVNFDPNAKRGIDADLSYPTSVYPCAKANNRENGLHPTQKPVALIEYLIRTYTNEGETVLDNTMGSGTTLVACVNTNRHGIGMELDATYFAQAKARIQAAQQQQIMEFATT